MRHFIKRALVLSLCVCILSLGYGCYGSFNLVKTVYKFNGNVSDNKFVVELVFIVMNVVPVYSLAAVVDVLIINSIEFWTGKNPVQAQNISTPDGKTGIAFDQATKTVTITQTNDDGTVRVFTLVPENGKTAVKDEAGTVLAYYSADEDGGISLLSSNGSLLKHFTREEAADFQNRMVAR